jgi:hypothetical protein
LALYICAALPPDSLQPGIDEMSSSRLDEAAKITGLFGMEGRLAVRGVSQIRSRNIPFTSGARIRPRRRRHSENH